MVRELSMAVGKEVGGRGLERWLPGAGVQVADIAILPGCWAGVRLKLLLLRSGKGRQLGWAA